MSVAFSKDFSLGAVNAITVAASLISPNKTVLGQEKVSFTCGQFRSDCSSQTSQMVSGRSLYIYLGIALLVVVVVLIVVFANKKKQPEVVSKK